MSAKSNLAIKSPLNYTGGKFRILNQIIPLFPQKITTFVDIFCGGLNVGINVPSEKLIANDQCYQIVELYELLKKTPIAQITKNIAKIIKDSGLSNTAKHGYEFYNSNAYKGVAGFNKHKYIQLRDKYNNSSKRDPLLFYVLVIFAFNNQIRFNSKKEFNLPVNKRDFTKNMQKNLEEFIKAIQSKDIIFESKDYRDIKLNKDYFIYLDPPYLIGNASYNENGGWTTNDESELLNFIDDLDKQGNHFALSNAIENKGNRNDLLATWSKKYNIHDISMSYSNANYQIKNKKINTTREVLITNY